MPALSQPYNAPYGKKNMKLDIILDLHNQTECPNGPMTPKIHIEMHVC